MENLGLQTNNKNTPTHNANNGLQQQLRDTVRRLVMDYSNTENKGERENIKEKLFGLKPGYEEFETTYLYSLRKGKSMKITEDVKKYLRENDIVYNIEDYFDHILRLTKPGVMNYIRKGINDIKKHRSSSMSKKMKLGLKGLYHALPPILAFRLLTNATLIDTDEIIESITDNVYTILTKEGFVKYKNFQQAELEDQTINNTGNVMNPLFRGGKSRRKLYKKSRKTRTNKNKKSKTKKVNQKSKTKKVNQKK